MSYIIGLLESINYKNKPYNLIFVIVNWLIKLIYYKLIQVIINISILRNLICNIVMKYYNILDLFVNDQGLIFIL